MANNKTIQTLSRNFIIPAGSQVVLQSDMPVTREGDAKAVTDPSSAFRKSGSVGVVVKCPPHNGEPYEVRFSDGSIAIVAFDELVLRRQEIENLLKANDTDYRRYIVYRCQVGSKAFGLANEDSDDDIRGIFLPPADLNWSLYEVPEQIESNDGQDDEVFWEMGKFVRLALKANPNILEVLWTPIVIEAEPIALKLREIRTAFLSKHIYKTYSGYVLSQFRRMKNRFEKTNTYKPKHAMHLLRLLYSGIGALETGDIMIDVSQHREHLLKVRNEAFSFEEVRQQALELDRTFQSGFEKTNLPDQPDFKAIDQFLIEARRSMVE